MVVQSAYKVYIEVQATFSPDGRVIPDSLIWEDGRKYYIDRIQNIERAASLKAGGVGIAYTCLIAGRPVHLFYEDHKRWFVERKTLPDGAGYCRS